MAASIRVGKDHKLASFKMNANVVPAPPRLLRALLAGLALDAERVAELLAVAVVAGVETTASIDADPGESRRHYRHWQRTRF